jgi:CRP/FNR family transcriptional regulator, cyclic AMP receptor protein
VIDSSIRGWPYTPKPTGSRIAAEERERRELALKQAPLFANVPRRHLRSIAKVTGVRGYEEGASIIREGDPGSTFYALLDGRAKVVRRGRTVNRLSPGDFFGEISLLDPGPRTASVVAESPLRCLTLGGKDFERVLAGEPVLALRILRELASRLRKNEGSADI